MRTLARFFPLIVICASVARAASPTVHAPYESAGWAAPPNIVDEMAFAQMHRVGVTPPNCSSDAVFIRRAFLDSIGTLPTASEVKEFLKDIGPDKRRILIDHLLERDEFADYQSMHWCDTLRVRSEFPINLWPNAVQAYQRWIHVSIQENKHYDQFAREMLTSSGSNFRVGQVNFYRAIPSHDPQAIARAVALTFMGCRAENWPKEQLSGMALCFAQIGYKYTAEWKEEIVYFDTSKAATRPAEFATATLPDGKIAHFSPDRDPREDFAAWLITPANPWFAKTAVNRVWFWLMGRGIIEEPDDIRPDNPPSNAQLLTALEHELIASKYDLKHIYRLILNSRTYQLSSIAASDRPQAASVFAAYPLRRLDAEVLIDAICQITGTTESYTSAVPEPYTIMPGDERAIDLPDGSITSSFLELFGRPARDSGLESSRNSRPSQDQRLHMLNSSHVQRKIEQSVKLRSLVRGKSNPREAIDELYLSILSRYPTSDEYQTTVSYLKKSSPNTREGWIDLTWALMNCSEFLYQH